MSIYDILAPMLKEDPHYQAIQEFYGDRKAKRTQVLYMDHIDQGLVVLREIQATLRAKQAYCLHPIVQMDSDFVDAVGDKSVLRKYPIDSFALALAVEYRRVANGYSSRDTEKPLEKIRLSPLAEVNDMLIADKVQNRADFDRYHKGTHPRSAELATYFENWLRRLGITEERYESLVDILRTTE